MAAPSPDIFYVDVAGASLTHVDLAGLHQGFDLTISHSVTLSATASAGVYSVSVADLLADVAAAFVNASITDGERDGVAALLSLTSDYDLSRWDLSKVRKLVSSDFGMLGMAAFDASRSDAVANELTARLDSGSSLYKLVPADVIHLPISVAMPVSSKPLQAFTIDFVATVA